MNKKTWLFLIPFIIFLLGAVFLFKGLYSDPTKLESVMVDKEVPVLSQAAQQEAPAAAAPPPPAIAPAALIINRQLRSGQRIYARHTDLIVIGAVSQGAEVVADGNIHVYGPLRGKAMAGARGDAKARIFTTELDPELIAIAGVYRIIETRLDAQLRNKPVVVTLEDDTLRFDPLSS